MKQRRSQEALGNTSCSSLTFLSITFSVLKPLPFLWVYGVSQSMVQAPGCQKGDCCIVPSGLSLP